MSERLDLVFFGFDLGFDFDDFLLAEEEVGFTRTTGAKSALDTPAAAVETAVEMGIIMGTVGVDRGIGIAIDEVEAWNWKAA